MLSRFLGSKFAKDNFIYIGGALFVGFLGYLFNFAISRKISVAQYGELQSLFSILSIFGVYSSALGYFIVKHVSVFAAHEDLGASRGFAAYLFRKTRWFVFLFFIIFIILIPVLNRLLHLSDSLGLMAMGIAILISLPTVIYGEILRGWQEFLLLTIISIITSIVKLISGVGLAIVYQKASAISFAIPLSALFGWLLAKYFSRKKLGFVKQDSIAENWKERYFSEASIRKTAIQIFIFSLGIILVSNLDMIIVKNLTSPETAGYYGALSLLGKIILLINLTVIAVMLPGACAQGYLGKRPNTKHILGSYGLIIAVSLIFILVYYFFSQLLVNLFFGNKYLLQADNLWLFGIMAFLLSLLSLEANLSFAKHDFRVVYFLGGVIIAMTLGIAKYHSNLREIVLAINTAFLLGFFAILTLNLFQEQKSRNPSANEKV